ncbi:peroxiredoxin [Engelhardtia mirabilis]|uniref:Peroxiredoxin n=1 Tax=Engelhardtia mirabilis TaxID=2528011 RepID=A0A518BGL0_9BACT|nr:Selenocysteine-containing peroxiredoxin PrxU [Planctomycetes bacterium Pla133]QDV00432.1 Selenocysteine-containing peroxiredoxin PrxU [Planctomycetes bacterium Pla86]
MQSHASIPFALPRLNEPAPYFMADTTHGPRALEDYAGRWLLLFSHPADFTPVCTSEFVALARAQAQFDALDCALLGLSVDSTYAHIAWVRAIEDKFGVRVEFPIIDDASMAVARLYGMVHPGESECASVRAVFVIDPDGMVRAMQVYPMTTGRSIDELLRLVRALRMSADTGLATPEGWQPGDDVVEVPPRTVQEANRAPQAGVERLDWYFARRPDPTRGEPASDPV